MVFQPKGNVERETIVWNGRKYNRYPNSKRRSHRVYFLRSGSSLHRDVWVHHNGEIPVGYHVHHIDGDTSNNDISNLECICGSEHFKKHAESRSKRSSSPEHLAHLASIRHKAALWHSSPEGIAWHRENAKTSICRADRSKWRKNLPILHKNCEVCGSPFETKNQRKTLCGSACQSKRSKAKKRAAIASMQNSVNNKDYPV